MWWSYFDTHFSTKILFSIFFNFPLTFYLQAVPGISPTTIAAVKSMASPFFNLLNVCMSFLHSQGWQPSCMPRKSYYSICKLPIWHHFTKHFLAIQSFPTHCFWYFYHSYIIVFLYHNSSTSCIICHLFNYFFKWYLIFSSDIPSITIYVRKNGSPASTYFLFAIAYNIVLLSSFVVRLPHETDMYASFDKCDTSFVGKSVLS